MENKPIAADAWENGRWKVEWSEMPAFGPGTLPLPFSRRYPVRCLWCGRELQWNVVATRKAFTEEHSHDDFPELPEMPKGRNNMKTREQVALDLLDDDPSPCVSDYPPAWPTLSPPLTAPNST